MSRNLIIKLVVILGLIGLCLLEVLPWKEKLKPGIDLAGGTSLLYRINTEGMTEFEKRTVEEDMIRILRKRIDPNNKRNLVWRPHGGGLIEIQMPLATKETQARNQRYREEKDALDDYNLDIIRVRQAMIQLGGIGEQRYQESRGGTFDELVENWRQRMEASIRGEGLSEGQIKTKLDDLAAAAQKRRDLLRVLALAHDTYEQDQRSLGTARENYTAAQDKLTEAGIDQTAVDGLYIRWREMTDPNQIQALRAIVGDDQKKQNLIREFLDVRTEMGYLRTALTDEETGSQVKKEQAWDELELVNIDFDRVDLILEASQGEHTPAIQELKDQYPLAADLIDKLVEAYAEYAKVEGRLDDPEALKRLLRGSGVLEWRILPKPEEGVLSDAEFTNYTDQLARLGPERGSDDRYVWKRIKSPETFTESTWTYCAEKDGVSYVLASNQEGEVMLRDTAGGEWKLQNVRATTDGLGRPAVGFAFNEAGTGLFFDMTKENKNRPLCILLDEEVVSAPNIETAIFGSGIIRGQFSQQEVMDMVDKLNAGALPARLSDQPESENTIGPTLGASNLNAGLRAGFYGLALVALFILVYYMVAGSLANVALFMNLLMIMGVMALSRATFTMPGIAGLILTIGMAVDANVLVFERIREEQTRGSSLRMAIKNGYSRAFRTILDANATTFITALILWMLASEEIKGFALTLMIGIVSSMFTALFVTRTIFDILTSQRIIKNNLFMLQVVKKPQVNWMKARPVFWVVSILLVISGWGVFISRITGYIDPENSMLSNEFTGGTSIHLVLTEEGAQQLTSSENNTDATLRDIVEARIHAAGTAETPPNRLIQTARVQQIGPVEDRRFEVVTTETNRLTVILTAIGANGARRSAAEIQAAVRDAAELLGDRRMTEATVNPLGAEGEFQLETRQTNHTAVQKVLTEALELLSKISKLTDDDINEQAEQLHITLRARTGAAVSVEEIRGALRQVADELGDPLLTEATVEPGPTADEFVVLTSRLDKERVKLTLNRTVAALSSMEYGAMQTQLIVDNAVTQALEGMLERLENLDPQNIISEPITAELVGQKLYLQPFLGGVLVTGEFGGGKTNTLGKLEDRFNQMQFKSEFDQYGRSEVDVFAPGEGKVEKDRPLTVLEMTATSEAVFYQQSSDEQWDEFVKNETGRFQDTLEQMGSFARRTQIDPSVGRKSMNDAMVAIVFSLLAIVIYVWVRFGTVRFGMAAVAALLHDVSIAMGLVAASAWLSTTFVGSFLGIRDFKIDLPMIAGFLTVIGYSLNDTIVVFDRVRENRGKLATMSANIINTSINQTISRTILTSVTTLIVLVSMYIFGGPGLRGFNFVLIIGVVVGTYSSVGIATPLLYGVRAEKAKQSKAAKNNRIRKNIK